MIRILFLAGLLALGAVAGAAAAENDTRPRVLIETNRGEITLELDAQRAPLSSANFLQYVREGFYDGKIFHRVIPDFMIQGGGFDAAMTRATTRAAITNEADNGLANRRGSVAMARTQDPHSAGAQFFINLKDNDFLDHREKSMRGWGYAVFGRVVAGMDIVDTIAATPTGTVQYMPDVPREAVVILSAREIPAAAP